MKTVIHAHTNYSYDANTSPEELVATACCQGVDCVAVTDHNDITGALATRRIAAESALRPVAVIIGEEISSADGHIIGLFLHERVPPGLSGEETAARIRSQGGLVLAPHPFSTLCYSSLRSAMVRLAPLFDAIEVCNAQNPLPWEDAHAARFARQHAITAYVGADSHIRGHLAAAYQLMPSFDGPAAFLAALRHAELCPGRFGLAYFASAGTRHIWGKLTGRAWPGFGANIPAIPQPQQAQQQAGPAPASF
jgi:hypothetical protein